MYLFLLIILYKLLIDVREVKTRFKLIKHIDPEENQNIAQRQCGLKYQFIYHNKQGLPTNGQLGQLAQCFDLPTNCRPPSQPIRGLKSKQPHKTRQETVTLRSSSNGVAPLAIGGSRSTITLVGVPPRDIRVLPEQQARDKSKAKRKNL
jgi:hypothetical protein